MSASYFFTGQDGEVTGGAHRLELRLLELADV